MTGPDTRTLPASVRTVLYLLLAKACFAIIEFTTPYLATSRPLPFFAGILSFAIPSVLIPLLLYYTLRRMPATGYWGTVAFVPLSLLVNVALLTTPYVVSTPLVNPENDPYAIARSLEMAGRLFTSFLSLLLIFAILRRPVRQWVTQREEVMLAQRYPSRRTPSLTEQGAWVVPVVVGILAPPFISLLVATMVGGNPLGDSLLDVLLEQLKGRAFIQTIFSLLPFAVLAGICHHNAGRIPTVTLWSVMTGGVLGILALMIPAYWFAWETLYNKIPGDEKTAGAMVFFFTPLYCLATMFGGMLLGWIFARILRRGVDDIVDDL
jgi:hypothetical protein